MPDKDTDRPLVTFALFAYNQENYIREAVKGAFSQTYEPLEIILSDDCSCDSTFATLRELAASYQGPHTVRVRQSSQNCGIAQHFSDVISEANGDFIVVAAGDDISHPLRTEISVKIMISNSDVSFMETERLDFEGASDVAYMKMMDQSLLENKIEQKFSIDNFITGSVPRLCGATRVLRKKDFLQFGALHSMCPTEDTPSILRMLISDLGLKSSFVGVARRIHPQNLSSATSLRRMSIDNIKEQYITDVKTAQLLGLISEYAAHDLFRWIEGAIERRRLRLILDSQNMSLRLFFERILGSRELNFREKLFAFRCIFSLSHLGR